MTDRQEMAQRLERQAADPRISLAQGQELDREASRLRDPESGRPQRNIMILPLPRN